MLGKMTWYDKKRVCLLVSFDGVNVTYCCSTTRPEWPTRILLYGKVPYIVPETLRQRSQEEEKTTYVVCGQIEML